MRRPIITLLTDFGLRDHYVAAMKGVILGICPDACLVDVSHQIEPCNIGEAQWTLSQSWKWFPAETVHLVVIDPGVGSERRPVAASAGGHLFVGPDNGVLWTALSADPQRRVHEITAAQYFNSPVSGTFHGRDIFGPVSAHLAAGLDISKVGKPLEDCVRLEQPKPLRTAPDQWTGVVLHIDRFGNIVTNLDWASFHWISQRPFRMDIGKAAIPIYRTTYSHAIGQEYFLTNGSSDFVEISLNKGNAANALGIEAGISFKIVSL